MAKSPKKSEQNNTSNEIFFEGKTVVSNGETTNSSLGANTEQQAVTGRAVFAVSRVDVGVAVHTAFLAEDGRLLQMPAVFPNMDYALQQIDEMRQMVINTFTQPS